MATALSLIIPANNEAAFISGCLEAVLASGNSDLGSVQTIVAANGCSDATATIARGFQEAFSDKGWTLDVIELAEGNKLSALDAADAAAIGKTRAYLDADVIVSADLLQQTLSALDHAEARYVSGAVKLASTKNWATTVYGQFYEQVPFMQQPAPGCGFFAMNAEGRARWDAWPRIISDDTFARLNFEPAERHQVAATYEWPLVDGLSNLIKVRRRQNAGVVEIEDRFPQLLANDCKWRFAKADLARAILRSPFGCAVYGFVSMVVKFTPGTPADWRRGR